LSGDEVIIWEIITGGFEKVASYFVKIATTCTEHVMFESSRLRSKYPLSDDPYTYILSHISPWLFSPSLDPSKGFEPHTA